MTTHERKRALVYTIALIGFILWFSMELGWIDRDSGGDIWDFVFGGAESELPAWEIAIVRMINKSFPGIAALCIITLASIYQPKEKKK